MYKNIVLSTLDIDDNILLKPKYIPKIVDYTEGEFKLIKKKQEYTSGNVMYNNVIEQTYHNNTLFTDNDITRINEVVGLNTDEKKMDELLNDDNFVDRVKLGDEELILYDSDEGKLIDEKNNGDKETIDYIMPILPI